MNHLNILPPNATKLEKSIIAAFLNQLANKDNNIRKLIAYDYVLKRPFFYAYAALKISNVNVKLRQKRIIEDKDTKKKKEYKKFDL
ncbi:hypothetical protein L3V82_13075 [Thiotrichales bacterium 19S3-7]|nr:hypothetical protein [Thiotrichales bacterium 19S3-7]MCF6803103.1 hypothetical protein [Thiotrichales bacterium 19S3-11]